jgi:sulfide dehydrogenase cytochrome subunit
LHTINAYCGPAHHTDRKQTVVCFCRYWKFNQFYGALNLSNNRLVRDVCRNAGNSSNTNIGNILKASAILISATFAFTALAADVDKMVEPCFACHGNNGVGTETKVPTIAGYSEGYFGFSLGMYKKSERPCVEVEYPGGSKKGLKTNMCEIMKEFSESDIDQIGEYFSRQKFVRTVQKFDPELAKKGEVIHMNKCDPCHSKAGSSPSDNIGILGGQKMDYLREQIKFVKEGKRFTSKKMKIRLDGLNDEELEAVVHYYGSIQ